jgi:adenylate kinase family enzyme
MPLLSPPSHIPEFLGREPFAVRLLQSCAVRRIALLGPAGAGKSWLGRQLAELLGVPVIHLDRLYWKAGWVATPDPEWQAIQAREAERESWIADGIQEGRIGASLWLDEADTIVFMDASPLTSVWRVTRRRLKAADGPEMPADCEPAPFYKAFPRFLSFLRHYRRLVRPEVLADLARREQGQQVAILRTKEDVQRFLASVKAHGAPLGESSLT